MAWSHPVVIHELGCFNNTDTSCVTKLLLVELSQPHSSVVRASARKVGSIPGLDKHFLPKYDCSLHQEQSLNSLWMIARNYDSYACLVHMS